MALFPVVLVRKKELVNNPVFMNHEHIHLRQQVEMLIIPFYILYGLHYLVNRIKYREHDKAYRHICFEREAYGNESDLSYIPQRKFWAWIKYI